MESHECHASVGSVVSCPPSTTTKTTTTTTTTTTNVVAGVVGANNNPMLLSAIEMLPGSIREYFLLTLTTTPFVRMSVSGINVMLRRTNVPEESLMTEEEFVLSSTAVVVTLVGYYVLFGKRHRRKRRRLAEELRLAQRQVRSSLCCFCLVVWCMRDCPFDIVIVRRKAPCSPSCTFGIMIVG